MDASALASAEAWLSAIATAKLIAAFLVAAGVVMEFGGEWISRPYERIVRDAQAAREAALRAETLRLSAEAEGAKAQIATATEAAAKANERAEDARLEQERLKQIVKWRTIEPADLNALIAEWRN